MTKAQVEKQGRGTNVARIVLTVITIFIAVSLLLGIAFLSMIIITSSAQSYCLFQYLFLLL